MGLLLVLSFHDSIIDYSLRLLFDKNTTELTITNQEGRTSVKSEEESAWDIKQRKIIEELSTRPEAGPVRCSLRASPVSPIPAKQELEVKLVNTSNRPAILRLHKIELDTITFLFRDEQGKVVHSFCYKDIDSDFLSPPLPPVYLRPYLFTAPSPLVLQVWYQ